MDINEIKFNKVKELITKNPEKYISIRRIALDVGIHWRTAKKYVKRLAR